MNTVDSIVKKRPEDFEEYEKEKTEKIKTADKKLKFRFLK